MSTSRNLNLPRSSLLTLLTTAALLETVWTIYVGWRLPRHYVANHWDLAWVVLDAAQVVMLVLAAWAAWQRRALLIIFASSAGTLLIIDAWFDVATARRGDVTQSLLMALILEIPSAVVLFWVAWRTIGVLTSEIFAGEKVWRITWSRGPDQFSSDS